MNPIFAEYVERGWSCVPVPYQKKKPIMPWKALQERMPGTTELTAWAAMEKTNVALICGVLSGIIVVDVDSDEGLAELHKHGFIPSTPQVKTAHGMHFYFEHPGVELRNRTRFVSGVDLRGDGGYIIAPPSVHETGHVYSWTVSPDEVPLASCPEWLLLLLQETKAEQHTKGATLENDAGRFWLGRALAEVIPGRRDDWGFWLACQLRDAGLSYADCETILVEFAQRCPAGEHPWTEKDAMSKVKSAFTQGARGAARSVNSAGTSMYPEKVWASETRNNGKTLPAQSAPKDKLPFVSSHAVFGHVLDELLEDDALSEYPPFEFPYKAIHQFGGFAHYSWRKKVVYILSGPGFGKTMFAEGLASTLNQNGLGVVWHGPEWSPEEMVYRAIQRYGGPTISDVAAAKIWRYHEAKGIPTAKRGGRRMSPELMSLAVGSLNDMLNWPGKTYYIPDADMALSGFVEAMIQTIAFARAEGQDVAAVFLDYLQLFEQFGAVGDSSWGERLAGIFKAIGIQTDVTTFLLVQPKKDESERVRNALRDGRELQDVMFDANSGHYLTDRKCNLFITLNPEFSAMGKPTGNGRVAVVKNSGGECGSVKVQIDFPHLFYFDAKESTAKRTSGYAYKAANA